MTRKYPTVSSTSNPLRSVCLRCSTPVHVTNYDTAKNETTNSPCGCVNGGLRFDPATLKGY